jgi:hypothetical protein
MILKWVLEKENVKLCTGFIWFRVEISSGPL